MDLLAGLARLGEVAEGQFGCLTRVQAAAAGFDPAGVATLMEAGLAEPVTTLVIRLRAGGRHPFPELYGAWLELEPGTPAWQREAPACGVVSHGSALRLYRVGDQPGPEVEFTWPTETDIAADQAVAHAAALAPDEWRDLAGMPVTSPARTLVDIAPRLDARELSHLGDAFVAHGWVTRPQLAVDLEQQMVRRRPPEDARSLLQDAVLERLAG